MPKTIEAIYENGVFKPLYHIEIKEHTRVRLVIEEGKSIALATSGIITARNKQAVNTIALEPEFLPEEA
jgi:predicted DNA-binding antitoxin AbrB/MazE fold protein